MNEISKQWSIHFPKYLYGLYTYGITFKQHTTEMMYYGGNGNSIVCSKHLEHYFKMGGTMETMPICKDLCICGVKIVENCFVVFRDDPNGYKKPRLIIGNCCIKRYIPFECRAKKCYKCDTLHDNYKSSFCDSCRKTCPQCGETKKNVVEAEICKKCITKAEKLMKAEELRRIETELAIMYQEEWTQRNVERKIRLEEERIRREEEQRIHQEAERIRLESERVIREKQREIDEADRATQLYLQKAKNQKKCECGKPITGTYPKCKTCFSKSKTCSMVGCNTKIMNPKYDRCYVCNKR
jgi:hypothetical protein